jgi:hypothetical protein
VAAPAEATGRAQVGTAFNGERKRRLSGTAF